MNGPADVRAYGELDEAVTSLMRTAISQPRLSARAFHRGLKLARTMADLADSAAIHPAHLAEALHLRPAEAAELIERAEDSRIIPAGSAGRAPGYG